MLKHRGAPGSSSEGVVIPVADMQGSKSRSSSGRKQENDGSGFLRLLWTFALMAASGYGGYAYFQASVFDSLVSSHRNQMATERSLADDLKSRLAAAESESAQLRSALATAKAEAAESAAGVAAQASETEKKEAKLKQLVAYKKKIHSGLQQYAKQRLLEKFGPDPHRVEIQLAYDPSSNIYSAEGGDRIVIEMAPSDEMPFTVFWFLSQVDRGLYNLTSFHRNARHVVQAGPIANFLTPPNSHLVDRFVKSGLDSVLFQEYSEKFPHVKYTLGYAGRPGGPDFYISTLNNVAAHGPGGQGSYDDPSEADPCFAKVIDGFDAVERMHKSDVNPGNFMRMKHYVAIQHVRILPKDDAGAIADPPADNEGGGAAAAEAR